MIKKIKRYLTASGIASAVFFSFTAGAFAVEPTPTPTDTPVPTPTPVDPVYSVVTIDDRQVFILVLPSLVLMALALAHFTYIYSKPFRFRIFK